MAAVDYLMRNSGSSRLSLALFQFLFPAADLFKLGGVCR